LPQTTNQERRIFHKKPVFLRKTQFDKPAKEC
jgi:hypothetical protein